jgi:hypothetical protein
MAQFLRVGCCNTCILRKACCCKLSRLRAQEAWQETPVQTCPNHTELHHALHQHQYFPWVWEKECVGCDQALFWDLGFIVKMYASGQFDLTSHSGK